MLKTIERRWGQLRSRAAQLCRACGYASFTTFRRDFERILDDPPYAKDWRRDEDAVSAAAARGRLGGFSVGVPRVNVGQAQLIQHMLSRMTVPEKGERRVAIIANGSPLVTWDAESSEREIRRWNVESDWLESIIALPEQMVSRASIDPDLCAVSNRKDAERSDRAWLVDATNGLVPMLGSVGEMRRKIANGPFRQITESYQGFLESECFKISDTATLSYHTITAGQPLRSNVQARLERITRLSLQLDVQNVTKSEKRNPTWRPAEGEHGQRQQTRIKGVSSTKAPMRLTSCSAFEEALVHAFSDAGAMCISLVGQRIEPVKFAALGKAILADLSERVRPTIFSAPRTDPWVDPAFHDDERDPLYEDVVGTSQRGVAPSVADAWIDPGIRDYHDCQVGRVIYVISATAIRTSPRLLEERARHISKLAAYIVEMLRRGAG